MGLTCGHCDYENNPHSVTCVRCGLAVTRSNPGYETLAGKPSPKLAIFDIDHTITDPARRERAARREKLKHGSAKYWRFMHQPEKVLTDVAIPGAVEFVNKLALTHVVAYVTARPAFLKAVTKEHLKDLGFPLMANKTEILLLMPDPEINEKEIPNWKADMILSLANEFDVSFFFDNKQENLDAARKVTMIPGLYESISEYEGKTLPNPKMTLQCAKCGASDQLDVTTDANGSLIHMNCGGFVRPVSAHNKDELFQTRQSLINPPPKPRKKKGRKEPSKVYFQRLMSALHDEFPDTSQRSAVALSYVEKYYNKKAVANITKNWAKDNPGKKLPLPLKKGITIYGTTNCIWCDRAKAYVKRKKLKYKYVDFTDRQSEYNETIAPLTNYWKTKPAVFVDGEFIGGHDALVARDNPPIREFLSQADISYVDQAKKHIRLVSPIISVDSRHMGIFEIPVMDKQPDNRVKIVGKTRLAFYTRSGTGSANRESGSTPEERKQADLDKAGAMYKKWQLEPEKYKYEMISESPFLRKIVGDRHGSEYGKTFEPLLWTAMYGENTQGGFNRDTQWYIKPHTSTTFDESGAAITIPPFPSKNWETKFESRFGHRSMFYAGIAIKEMYPNPETIASPIDWKTTTLNGFIKQYGGTLSKYATPTLPNPSAGILPIMSGEPTTKHKKLGAVFAEVVIGRNIFKDVGEVIQHIYRGLVGGRISMNEKRMAMAVATMQKELSDRAEAVGGNAVANLKVDYETIGSMNVTIIATADAVKMRTPPKTSARSNPVALANPPSQAKLNKAKKLYKSFNNKAPKEVKKAKVDVGDVWVNLGSCWSIGYRNGKETGDEDQKYIHHFGTDEETGKTFEEPELFLAMSETQKPLLIIRGGEWKVKTDDEGVSWIYY